MSEVERRSSALVGEQFSVTEAIGGWRGFIETAIPGVVFVTAFVIWGGFKIPVIASVITLVVLAVIRVIQKMRLQEVFSGAFGVALGALWAWRTGEASGYYAPGLWLNTLSAAGLLISIAIRYPVVGLVVGLIKGGGNAWRTDPKLLKIFSWATAIVAFMYLIRLGVQWPLYLTDQVAALGTAKIVLGLPLFALTLWVVWFVVRPAVQQLEPHDQPQQPE